MRRSTQIFFPSSVLVAGVTLGLLVTLVPPARAGTERHPEILDAVGDANMAWHATYRAGQEDPNGVSTSPASLASADVEKVWLETAYRTRAVRKGKRLVAVKHVPTGVEIHVRTAAPFFPSPGPTIVVAMGMYLGYGFGSRETMSFRIAAWGPLSSGQGLNAAEPRDGAQVWLSKTVDDHFWTTMQCEPFTTSNRYDITPVMRGRETISTIPLRLCQGLLKPGTIIRNPPSPYGGTSYVYTALDNIYPAVVDPFARFQKSFVIGADVPEDLSCRRVGPRRCHQALKRAGAQ